VRQALSQPSLEEQYEWHVAAQISFIPLAYVNPLGGSQLSGWPRSARFPPEFVLNSCALCAQKSAVVVGIPNAAPYVIIWESPTLHPGSMTFGKKFSRASGASLHGGGG